MHDKDDNRGSVHSARSVATRPRRRSRDRRCVLSFLSKSVPRAVRHRWRHPSTSGRRQQAQRGHDPRGAGRSGIVGRAAHVVSSIRCVPRMCATVAGTSSGLRASIIIILTSLRHDWRSVRMACSDSLMKRFIIYGERQRGGRWRKKTGGAMLLPVVGLVEGLTREVEEIEQIGKCRPVHRDIGVARCGDGIGEIVPTAERHRP